MDVFLEFFCFLDDPVVVGNMISCSSAFLKTSLNIWKFTVHLLLKPGLKNFPQFAVIHPVKGFGVVDKAEIDIFLELSCFFDDPDDEPDNLISGSSAFLKSSLNIWKFMVHILLKPGLEILSITLLACEMSAIVW